MRIASRLPFAGRKTSCLRGRTMPFCPTRTGCAWAAAARRSMRFVMSARTFAGKRILCIHSGGDSKRVPQYSACGKLFSPVPRELPNGRRSTLFDEFIIGMSGVPSRIRDGMLVLSGDVLLLFNPLQIDAPASGAAAISFKEDVETGKNHGVFQMDEQGNVGEFLHKQTVETLTSRGAVNAQGKVDIDTGAVLFSAVFLINEPYTCAHHRMGRILYGVLVGGVSMGFRYYGVYETGVCFAVLAVNSISAWIDRTEVRLYRLLHHLPASGAGKEAAE